MHAWKRKNKSDTKTKSKLTIKNSLRSDYEEITFSISNAVFG